MRILLLTLSLFVVSLSTAFGAPQSKTVKPNGTIAFTAATGGVTRISLNGTDRIKELVATDSNFEPKANGETGDVFLRFIGKGRAGPEDGFIVTERGHTINYSLTPKDTASETVLINLVVPRPVEAVEAVGGRLGAVSSSDGHIPAITVFLRQVLAKHVDGRAVPKRRSGSVVATMRSGNLRARVLVVAASSKGGSIRPQSFYKTGVVSVLIDKPNLGPGQRSFVVVVEQRS